MLDNFRCHCCRRRRRHSFYLHSLSSLCVCVYRMQDTADEHSLTRLATKMNVNTIFSRAHASAFFVCVHCDVRSTLLARSRRLVFNILSFIYLYIYFFAIARYYCSFCFYFIFILVRLHSSCFGCLSMVQLTLILLHFWHFFCFSIRFVCVRVAYEKLLKENSNWTLYIGLWLSCSYFFVSFCALMPRGPSVAGPREFLLFIFSFVLLLTPAVFRYCFERNAKLNDLLKVREALCAIPGWRRRRRRVVCRCCVASGAHTQRKTERGRGRVMSNGYSGELLKIRLFLFYVNADVSAFIGHSTSINDSLRCRDE